MMYRQHFSMTRYPFEQTLHADELYESAAVAETGARLNHLVELRGIGLITGEAGSGKTVACRRFVADLAHGLHRVVYVALTTGTGLDTANSIAREFGLSRQRSRAGVWHQVRDEVSRLSCEARQLPVLIVDEAHHLHSDLLEDLRLLTNFGMESEHRLCLLLVGLTELRHRLAKAVHESLAQRLVVRHHISGLAEDEVEPYIRHRLKSAGAADIPIFSANAVEAIARASHGMPRRINQIAHLGLVCACQDKSREVSGEHVFQACQELNLKA